MERARTAVVREEGRREGAESWNAERAVAGGRCRSLREGKGRKRRSWLLASGIHEERRKRTKRPHKAHFDEFFPSLWYRKSSNSLQRNSQPETIPYNLEDVRSLSRAVAGPPGSARFGIQQRKHAQKHNHSSTTHCRPPEKSPCEAI